MIVLLCDSLGCSLLQYFHSHHLGLEPFGLEDALASEAEQLADSDSTLAKGEPHLSHQLLCFTSLFLNVEKSWMQLLDFLRVEACAMSDLPHAYADGGDAKHIDDGLRQAFADQVAPTYRWMVQIYGIVWPLLLGL